MHPSEEIRGVKGSDLKGKKIALGVSGSIGAVECVKLVRELIREGAEVHCVMSEWAQNIIHPYSLEFASGNDVITELTGQVEHVKLCGKVQDKVDLYLVAPATANTISKMAKGIDDTPVTTFATTAIGSGIPLVIVPAMHQSMYEHPIITENIEILKEKVGATFVGPRVEEGSAKVAGNEMIVDSVIRELNDDFRGKKITVITGRSQEPIDSMRTITNRASGRSGVELARRAYRRGADVELWYGNVSVNVPEWIPTKQFDSIHDLMEMKDDVEGTVIVPAALSDFEVEDVEEKKIDSSESLSLELTPAPKFIDSVKESCELLVAYKAADDEEKAVEKGKGMLEEGRADMVVANSLENVRKNVNRVYLVNRDTWFEGTKREIADNILDEIERELYE